MLCRYNPYTTFMRAGRRIERYWGSVDRTSIFFLRESLVSNSTFRVGVTGDTGIDIYTEYVAGYVSSDTRVRSPKAAWDVEVPAGARFVSLAFSKLLTEKSIHIDYILPKQI